MQYDLLAAAPYALTSDDVLFQVHADRKDIPAAERGAARAVFFGKPQACLRASPLVKSFGWGLHYDADRRVALVARETSAYAEFTGNNSLEQRTGMRSKRAQSVSPFA